MAQSLRGIGARAGCVLDRPHSRRYDLRLRPRPARSRGESRGGGGNAMKYNVLATSVLILLAATTGSLGQASAQTAPRAHEIPQSFVVAHQETLAELTAIGKRRTHTGSIAREAISAVKRHFEREEEYILPPLTLAPAIARAAVADARNDTEVNEPMAIVIGEYLRAKLGP